jgi:hypothetical protein
MDDFRAPDETAAQARTWNVVGAAFADREPSRPRRRRRAPFAVAVGIAALAAVAFTSPGHAVLTSVRKAIGIEHAQRALYSLPTGGRLLVDGWIVNADGSTRRLGDYRETAWSPHGRYVIATRTDELLALTPEGAVRWTLARPDVRFPSWAGTFTDTRIAYLSGDRLRVVAGDDSDDREVGPAKAAPVAPAWRPGGAPFTLAYADVVGRVWVLQPDARRLLFRTVRGPQPTKLVWSRDGSRLLVLRRRALDVYDVGGRRTTHLTGHFADAAFVGGRVVVLTPHAVELGGHVLFRTSGTLRQVVPSPDGRWLLVTWPEADQWLFVRVAPGHRVTAVGNIAEQLGGGFAVDGWTS